MQATARVLDTRESRTGLESARDIASRLALGQQSPATVETGLTRVSLTLMKSPEQALDRPRTAQVTINYLRN